MPDRANYINLLGRSPETMAKYIEDCDNINSNETLSEEEKKRLLHARYVQDRIEYEKAEEKEREERLKKERTLSRRVRRLADNVLDHTLMVCIKLVIALVATVVLAIFLSLIISPSGGIIVAVGLSPIIIYKMLKMDV
jgi:RNase adaptor protein for sRNA GlmZ degradation